MTQKSCYDTVYATLKTEDASLANEDWVKTSCSIIDKMVDDGELEFIMSVISSGCLVVILECDYYISLDDCDKHPFFKLIQMFDRLSFLKVNNNRLRIKLVKNISKTD